MSCFYFFPFRFSFHFHNADSTNYQRYSCRGSELVYGVLLLLKRTLHPTEFQLWQLPSRMCRWCFLLGMHVGVVKVMGLWLNRGRVWRWGKVKKSFFWFGVVKDGNKFQFWAECDTSSSDISKRIPWGVMSWRCDCCISSSDEYVRCWFHSDSDSFLNFHAQKWGKRCSPKCFTTAPIFHITRWEKNPPPHWGEEDMVTLT